MQVTPEKYDVNTPELNDILNTLSKLLERMAKEEPGSPKIGVVLALMSGAVKVVDSVIVEEAEVVRSPFFFEGMAYRMATASEETLAALAVYLLTKKHGSDDEKNQDE
jgi:hypothetical protein